MTLSCCYSAAPPPSPTLHSTDAPERIVFVLKELQPENWINNGSCYSVQLKPAGVSQLVQRVLDIEGNAEHWSLKDRWVFVGHVFVCMLFA